MILYKSTKTYGNDVGISCAFRQWKATHSHCSKLHGYALGFRFIFSSKTLDDKNWVVDFGGLKGLKQQLLESFDHKTVVAKDDPMLEKFKDLEKSGAIDLTILDFVGCEKFAEYAYNLAVDWLVKNNMICRVSVESVEVFEHGANSAIYTGEQN